MIVIRSAVSGDAADIAKVHIDSWKSTYCGLVSDSYLRNLEQEKSERRWRETLTDEAMDNVVIVAEIRNCIVGFAVGGSNGSHPREFNAELHAIYILESFHGNGIGKRLVKKMSEILQDNGHKSIVVWVLADNTSSEFYKHLGGTTVAQKMLEIGGKKLAADAYGWNDISVLF